MKNPTFIDLFSGVGMFRLGMEQAGFTCAGYCEIDPFAIKSYCAMHQPKGGEWFEKDICKINPHELPNVPVWTAGFPCQDLSHAGTRQGLQGDRSGLFYEIIRLLRECNHKPRFLILENVKGLLSSCNGWDYGTILCELATLGYNCEWSLCNTKNFGIPQNRERVFIVCDLTGECTGKIFPVGNTNPKTLEQILGGSQGYRVYCQEGLSATIASQAGGMGAKTGLYLMPDNKALNSKEPRAMLTPDRLEKRQNGRRIKNENEAMFTLTTRDVHGIFYNARIRRLTPNECFRLQGVPDYLYDRAAKVCSDNQLYKQAGNGVSVPVVFEIGKKIIHYLNETNQNLV